MGSIVGICGGSGAGKSTLVEELIQRLDPEAVSALAFDAYYRDLSHITMQQRMQVNYDHPDALDHEAFIGHLQQLRSGRRIEVPVYDFATHTRKPEVTLVEAKEIVLLDGILLLHFQQISELIDLAVFIDIPEQVRLARRTQRDVRERGRDADDVWRQFYETVAPMHDKFVQPSIARADRVVELDERLEDVANSLVTEIAAMRHERRSA